MSGGGVGGRLQGLAMGVERRRAGLVAKVASVGGLDVAFDEAGRGTGPTVVMLHGYTADRDVWARFATQLKGYHLVVPDLPGHGATPYVAEGDFSAPAQARVVVGLLDHLGIDRAHVIGNSMGGFVAAWVALQAPDRVRTLGLCDAAGVRAPVVNEVERLVDAGRSPFLVRDRREFDAFYRRTMARPPFTPGVVRAALARDYVARRDDSAAIFAGFHGRDYLEDRLADIAAPTWVVWGALDQITDVSMARVFVDGIAGARLTTYDDLGHMPMLEAPRRMARDYVRFVVDASAASTAS